MSTSTSQTDRVEAALVSGKVLSAKQIGSMFKIASPAKIVSLVRQRGNAVYLNKHTDTKGRTTMKYRVGTPSKALVAAGYRALAAGL